MNTFVVNPYDCVLALLPRRRSMSLALVASLLLALLAGAVYADDATDATVEATAIAASHAIGVVAGVIDDVDDGDARVMLGLKNSYAKIIAIDRRAAASGPSGSATTTPPAAPSAGARAGKSASAYDASQAAAVVAAAPDTGAGDAATAIVGSPAPTRAAAGATGGVGAGNGGSSVPPPVRRHTIDSQAWRDLQGLGGRGYAGSDEKISEDARQGSDTSDFRNPELTPGMITTDRAFGSTRSPYYGPILQDARVTFISYRQQRDALHARAVELRQQIEQLKTAQTRIKRPDGQTSLSQMDGEIMKYSAEAVTAGSRASGLGTQIAQGDAAADREYDKCIAESNRRKAFYDDWGALPEKDCTQAMIDGFMARHPGTTTSRSDRTEGDTIYSSWALTSVLGEPLNAWDARVDSLYQSYLRLHNQANADRATKADLDAKCESLRSSEALARKRREAWQARLNEWQLDWTALNNRAMTQQQRATALKAEFQRLETAIIGFGSDLDGVR